MMTDQNEPYSSPLIDGLLDNITTAELRKTKVKMVLAARIDDILQQKGWTKKQFALKLSKSPSEITKWLSGTHNFTIDTLSDICHVLDMDISALFRRSPEQTISTWIGITTSKNEPYDIKDPAPFQVQEKDTAYIKTTDWHSEASIISQNNSIMIMAAEKSKPQPVSFQFRSIQLLESFLAEPADLSEPIPEFSFDIRMELKINDEHQWFMLLSVIKVCKKDQNDVLGKIKTECVYHLDPFEDITVKGKDGKIKIPKPLTDMLNSISLSTTRGIMFSAFRGTYLHHAVLPVIDPTKLTESES